MSAYGSFRKRHEALLKAFEQGDSDLERDISQFIEAARSSTAITDPRQRDELRAYLRFWATRLHETTGYYPSIELPPVRPDTKSPLVRPAIFLLGMILLVIASLQLAATTTIVFGVASSSASATPYPSQTKTPTRTMTSTFTSAPSSTPLPTNTPRPLGTPIQIPPASIHTDNASQVVQLSRLGNGKPWEIALSPNGQFIAVGSSLGVYIYDAETLALALHIPTESWVGSVDYSPDGIYIAGGMEDDTIGIWRVDGTEPPKLLVGHAGDVTELIISSDGTRLFSASLDHDIRIWSFPDGNEIATLAGHSRAVDALALTIDGELLASGSLDTTIRIWDASNGSIMHVLRGHMERIRDLAFSPDGELLLSGSADNTARVWEMPEGNLLRAIEPSGSDVSAVSFTSDPSAIALGSYDSSISIWDYRAPRLLHELRGHRARVIDLNMARTSSTLFSTSDDGGMIQWDILTGRALRELNAHYGWFRAIEFSADGSALIASSSKHTLDTLSLPGGSITQTWDGMQEEIVHIAVSPVGTQVAVATGSVVRVWSWPNGKHLFDLVGHGDQVWDVAYSPDGAIIASASFDGTVRIWDAVDGTFIDMIDGHAAAVTAVAFSHDNSYIATGSLGEVRIWQGTTLEPIHTFRASGDWIWDLVFAPDSLHLASPTLDGAIRMWDLEQGSQLFAYYGHQGPVNVVVFSPDGSLVASGGQDKTVQLWDSANGQRLALLEGHHDWINGLAFNPDQTVLASVSGDATLRIWGVPSISPVDGADFQP